MSGRRIGNYLITDYIGGGGFGSVFKAEDTTQPGRIIAIKELHKKHTRNAVIKQRFFQEAVAMARLDHKNLPRLFTFGEDNGCYYLVMEFISGRVLADELHENGPMTTQLATGVLAQVLEAVSYAHHNGIIHRDLKPDNIILVAEGGNVRVKVLDFGIARLVGGESLTLAGEGFGTPAYMSPERMWGNTSDDPRIDIYAIGIILFEMLSGRAPFQSGASDPVIYWSEMRDLHEKMPLPALADRGVSPELERIIHRATAKRIEDRYASADEMLADLKRVIGDNGAARAPGTLMAATGAAQLALTTVPGGAEVYVDDTLRGTSDAIRGKVVIEPLAPGLHTVRVSKIGYSDYKISVALEAGQQTDLQVSLPARATAIMSSAESTEAVSFETIKAQTADETQTALLVLEGLPLGAMISVDSQPVASAGGDGRASVRLAPGQHEVRVTDPNGANAATVVDISEADRAMQKTLTMPINWQTKPAAQPTRPAAVSGSVPLDSAAPAQPFAAQTPSTVIRVPAGEPEQARPTASPKGRRLAYVASAILLMALAAGAFVVFRRPAQSDAQPDATTNQAALIAPSAAPDTAAANTNTNAAQPAEANAQPQSDAEQSATEKKLAETERKLKEEQQKNAKNDAATPAPAPVAVTPPAPAPPKPEPPKDEDSEPPAAGKTCAVVSVTGPSGETASGLRVMITQDGASFSAHTGPRGRCRACGLTPGHQVRVAVFGPRGAVLGTGSQSLSAGLNFISVQLNRAPGPSPQSGDGGSTVPRRRGRFQRP